MLSWGSGGSFKAGQSHAKIMQLLSGLQGSLAPGQKCTNKQLTTAGRHRLKGLALTLSVYATSLWCPLSNTVLQFPYCRAVPGKSRVRSAEERWARSQTTRPPLLKPSALAWNSHLSLQSQSVVTSQAHSGFYWFGAADPQAGSLGSIFSERS